MAYIQTVAVEITTCVQQKTWKPNPLTPTLQLRSIQHVCNLQGTLTCPTPTPTLQLRSIQHVTCVPLTRNVNMPLPTLTLQMHSKSKKKPLPATAVQQSVSNYTTLITLLYSYNLKLQLHYATTTPTTTALNHTTSSSCGEVTTATIASIADTRENTTPPTFRSISGFALPSVIHSSQPLL